MTRRSQGDEDGVTDQDAKPSWSCQRDPVCITPSSCEDGGVETGGWPKKEEKSWTDVNDMYLMHDFVLVSHVVGPQLSIKDGAKAAKTAKISAFPPALGLASSRSRSRDGKVLVAVVWHLCCHHA